MSDENLENLTVEDASDPEAMAERMLEAETMAKEMTEARERILGTEASVLIINHAFGMYELAAIHVTADEPNMDDARLSIDALEALVVGLKGRLGENEEPLGNALADIKLIYVRRVNEIKAQLEDTES